MQKLFFPLLFSILHFGAIQILVISIGFLWIFYWKIKYESSKIWNLHRKIETGRIFERPNRKCVVSPKGNPYRRWVDCVPHPSKALGKGARRVSATGVSEWLRYCSTLQCGSSLRYCSTLQCGSSLDSVGIAF